MRSTVLDVWDLVEGIFSYFQNPQISKSSFWWAVLKVYYSPRCSWLANQGLKASGKTSIEIILRKFCVRIPGTFIFRIRFLNQEDFSIFGSKKDEERLRQNLRVLIRRRSLFLSPLCILGIGISHIVRHITKPNQFFKEIYLDITSKTYVQRIKEKIQGN